MIQKLNVIHIVAMAECDIGSRFFTQLAEYPVAVCKECKHGVWPDQIEGHLQRSHKIPRKKAGLVGSSIRGWPGLARYPSELELPSQIVDPIPEIPLYSDGWLCQLEPIRCHHVVRSMNAMKNHWREYHDHWSAGKKRGRPSRTKEKAVQAQIEEGCERIYCQRMFVQGRASQYFRVREPVEGEPGQPEPVPVGGEAAWARVGKEMAEAMTNIEKRAQTTIQHGERDEVNP